MAEQESELKILAQFGKIVIFYAASAHAAGDPHKLTFDHRWKKAIFCVLSAYCTIGGAQTCGFRTYDSQDNETIVLTDTKAAGTTFWFNEKNMYVPGDGIVRFNLDGNQTLDKAILVCTIM
jgi:hypothetical protein